MGLLGEVLVNLRFDMQRELRRLGRTRIPRDGPLSVSVPGAVRGWWDLHQAFGKLPWADLFAPAIRYARFGHPVAQVIAAEWYVPPNTSTLTSGGRFPHALDGFLRTFTVEDAATGKRRTPRVLRPRRVVCPVDCVLAQRT